MPAIVIVFPTGEPECLTPVTQQSPGLLARTGEVWSMSGVKRLVVEIREGLGSYSLQGDRLVLRNR